MTSPDLSNRRCRKRSESKRVRLLVSKSRCDAQKTFCFRANCYSQLAHQVSPVSHERRLSHFLSVLPRQEDKPQYINPTSSHVRCWHEARETKVSTFVSQKDRNRDERGSLIHCLPAWLSYPTCVDRFISSCLLEPRQGHQRTPASARGTPEP